MKFVKHFYIYCFETQKILERIISYKSYRRFIEVLRKTNIIIKTFILVYNKHLMKYALFTLISSRSVPNCCQYKAFEVFFLNEIRYIEHLRHTQYYSIHWIRSINSCFTLLFIDWVNNICIYLLFADIFEFILKNYINLIFILIIKKFFIFILIFFCILT